MGVLIYLFTPLSPSSVYVLCPDVHTVNAMPHSTEIKDLDISIHRHEHTPVPGYSVTSISGHRDFTSYLNVTLPALCYYNVIPLIYIYNTRKMPSWEHSPIFNGKSVVKI
jgi:hypothetical protein